MSDPFRPRPPVFPRERLERAGVDPGQIEQLSTTFDGYSYRERVAFSHFVNSHSDEAIHARIADDDVTSDATQPTGGQVTDPQQQQQVDAAAAAGADPGVPGPQPTGTTADTTPAPTDPTPPASPEAAPQAEPATAPAPAPEAPAEPATPADAAPAPEQPAPAAPAPEVQTAPAPDAAPATPTVQVGDTAVPAEPGALGDLTIDQLRDAARNVGVPVTGRKADLVDRVATAAAATGEQAAITPEQVQAAQPATDATSAPQPPAEAPAPADAPQPATGDTGAQQAPAATDGGTPTGGTTP